MEGISVFIKGAPESSFVPLTGGRNSYQTVNLSAC